MFARLSERIRVQFILFLRGLNCVKWLEMKKWKLVFQFHISTGFNSVCSFSADQSRDLWHICAWLGAFMQKWEVDGSRSACWGFDLTYRKISFFKVFGPILSIIRSCVMECNFNKRFDDSIETPYAVLTMLLDVRMEDKTRPIAELVFQF